MKKSHETPWGAWGLRWKKSGGGGGDVCEDVGEIDREKMKNGREGEAL